MTHFSRSSAHEFIATLDERFTRFVVKDAAGIYSFDEATSAVLCLTDGDDEASLYAADTPGQAVLIARWNGLLIRSARR